jgi:putative membrane protein
VKGFLQAWAVNSLSVLLAVAIVPGVDYQRPMHLLLAALLFGVLNAFVKPLLIVISLLWLTGWMLKPAFVVDGFWPAFFGALVISITATLLEWAATGRRPNISFTRAAPKPGRDDNVIDV